MRSRFLISRAAADGVSPSRLRLSSTAAGLLSILAGTAGGQVIAAACAPILSRAYEPADFGVFTVVSAAAAILGTVAALRFELAIPLPRRNQDVYSLVALGLLASALTLVVGLLLAFLWSDDLADKLSMPELTPWLWLVPMVAATIGASAILNQLAVREQRFRAVGRRSFLQYSVMTLTQVVGGVYGAGPGGLVLGLSAGQIAGGTTLLKGSGLRSPEARASARWLNLRAALVSYGRFPLLLAPAGLINVTGSQIPVVLFAFFYGAEVAGWLAFTQRILALPIALVGTAIAQVYLGKVAAAARLDPRQCRGMHVRASRTLAALGVTTSLILAAFGPWLFTTLFGDPWATSGVYSQALALSLAAQFVAAPLSQTLVVFGMERAQFMWDVLRLLLVVGSVPVAFALGASPSTAIWFMSGASTFCYSGLWVLSLRAVTAGRGAATSWSGKHNERRARQSSESQV